MNRVIKRFYCISTLHFCHMMILPVPIPHGCNVTFIHWSSYHFRSVLSLKTRSCDGTGIESSSPWTVIIKVNMMLTLWSLIALLTHWGRVTHICVSKQTISGSDNGLSPGRRQAINWTSAGILSIGPFGTNFSENLTKILTFSFKKMRLKVSSAKLRPFYLGLNVLSCLYDNLCCHQRLQSCH